MGFKNVRRQIIQETDIGVYVWRLPTGEVLADEDGNFMLIQSRQGDKMRMDKLAEAAKHYGFEEGYAEFWAGKRPITDEEYEEQMMRHKLGLVPDPLDPAAIREQQEAARWRNK